MSEPTPAVLYAQHQDVHGQLWSLALVRTRWSDEGHVMLERSTPKGDVDLLEPGAWYRRGSDDGPSVLRVEIPGLEDQVDAREVNHLLAGLVDQKHGWGFESYEDLS